MKMVLIPVLVLHLNLKAGAPTRPRQGEDRPRTVPRSAQLWANSQQKFLLRAEAWLLSSASSQLQPLMLTGSQEKSAKANLPTQDPNSADARHPNLSHSPVCKRPCTKVVFHPAKAAIHRTASFFSCYTTVLV